MNGSVLLSDSHRSSQATKVGAVGPVPVRARGLLNQVKLASLDLSYVCDVLLLLVVDM